MESKVIFYKAQSLELVVNGASGGNTQGQFQFQPQPFLQGKNISSIEVYSANDVTVSPLQNALVTVAQLKSSFITLYMQYAVSGQTGKLGTPGNWVQQMPLWNLHRISNGSDPYVRDLFQLYLPVITWEKSYITYTATGGLGNTSNLSYLFNIGYAD